MCRFIKSSSVSKDIAVERCDRQIVDTCMIDFTHLKKKKTFKHVMPLFVVKDSPTDITFTSSRLFSIFKGAFIRF